MSLFYFLVFLWFLREIKSILFWLYLWQLKEYRLDRFLAHFDTFKGKRIFLNLFFIFKIFLFILGILFWNHLESIFLLIIFFIYLVEVGKGILDSSLGKIIKPVFTKKILFLISINIFFLSLFSFLVFHQEKLPLFLLGFDIFTFVFVSFFIFLFQPFVFFYKEFLIFKAKEKRRNFKELIVIGITGSYGKTSTKEFLATILSKKFQVLKTEKNQNNEISISKCILENLKSEHQVFVCEIGAYKKGEVEKVAKMIQPKVAILTGINQQHLSLFKNMENLISAEGGKELVKFLPKDGILILNGENSILREIYQKEEIEKRIVALSKKDADFWAENILVEKEKISFSVFEKNGDFANFEVNLVGFQNLINLLLAICCAKEVFKMSLKEISLATKKITQEQTGVELIKTKYDFSLIKTTYSTNPDAVFIHLDHLKLWEGKKILVMPCLIELGSEARRIHKKIGEKINKICDLAIITTLDYFKEIKERAKERAIFLEEGEKIFKKIINFCKKEDVILLEGRVPEKLIKLLKI